MSALFVVLLALQGFSWSESKSSESDDVMKHPHWRYLNTELCGYSRKNRIVGGRVANLGEYPWMALIGYENRGKIGYVCGGAILNRHYVLTAAHCADNPIVNRHLTIWAGEHRKEQYIDCEGAECAPPVQMRKVGRITIHPEYDTIPKGKVVAMNDIAILQLRTPLDLNEFVHPVCLPADHVKNISFSDRKAHIAGWGTYELGGDGKTSVYLKKLLKKVLTEEACSGFGADTDSQICAGGDSGAAACNGDSGGPLTLPVTELSPRFMIIGLVSYGPAKCGIGHHPDVYTKVANYLPFVLDNIEMA